MKTRAILSILLLTLTAFAAPVERAKLIALAVTSGEAIWQAAQDPAGANIRQGTMLTYALALCEAKVHSERLETLFDVAYRMQDRNPASPTYGSFRWLWNDEKIVDANAIEFSMQPAAILWLKHRDYLPAAARAKLREILDPAVKAALRHRVSDGYTNIALMSAGNLIALGEGMGLADVADEGYKRLQAVFELTLKTGIREYVSPDYYGVDLDALQLAATFAQRAAGRRQAQALVELFWTDVAAHFWWPNQRLGGAHSRNYDYLHGKGGLDRQLWAAGWITEPVPPSVELVFAALSLWTIPADLISMSQSKLPRIVRQMWGGAVPGGATPGAPAAPEAASGAMWGAVTHWLGRDVTLGIGGKNYGVIDIPLAFDFPGSRDDVRGFFISDARGDPYGKSKIPWRGHPKAVHLECFLAAAQEAKDALAVVVYRDKDVPAEATCLRSHLVFPRTLDGVFVGDERIEFQPGAPRAVPVKLGQPVVLRKGTAAVALRIPSARTMTGAPAAAELAWDGNEWDALRLTVDHALKSQKGPNPAAAIFQIRVGSELNDAAFAEFRARFAAALPEVTLEADRISAQAPATGRRLLIEAKAPWDAPTRIDPAVPRVVLEIDGHDVGRKILEAAR